MIGVILLFVLIGVCAVWAYNVFLKGHKLPPLYPGVLPIIGHIHLAAGDGIRASELNLKCVVPTTNSVQQIVGMWNNRTSEHSFRKTVYIENYSISGFWRFTKELAAECIKRGGVISFLFGSNVYYFISDPEDALTAANACLQKHYAYDFGKAWLGDGLITGSGEIWKRHRKLLTPAFSLPVTYGFMDIFNSQSRKFVKRLKNEVGKPFDPFPHLKTITLETFCLTGFGIPSLEVKNFSSKYMHAAESILSIIVSRFQNYWLHSDFIFKLSGQKKKLDELVRTTNDMTDKIIQQKKLTMSDNENENVATTSSGIRYIPFLDLLLRLSKNKALTDKEIREEVDTATIAGYDTSAVAFGGIMLVLGTYPEVQEKVYNEIISVFETDRDVEKEDFQKLIYTEVTLKEILRFCESGVISIRYVDKDVKLKNYTMRAGSQCILALFAIHRDPIWGEDAAEFRPERWLNKSELPDHPGAFAIFSIGKRSCPGKNYAMVSMMTMLVHFIRRYKISADYSKTVCSFDFIVKPVSGHEICIEERN